MERQEKQNSLVNWKRAEVRVLLRGSEDRCRLGDWVNKLSS